MITEHPVISPKKLIEVALPLDAINAAAKEEKAVPRHGHPQALHYWWARRPLAAARAVIFSQLVHDPEDLWWHQNPGAVPNAQVRGHWTKARQKLFKIIEELVLWENTGNDRVLNPAREAIRESWIETCELNKNHPKAAELFNPDKMPGLHDPFAGGGAIPLEAQRLGIRPLASDLNPVAVLINKAMIEIPPKFAGRPPVHPSSRSGKSLLSKDWKAAEGLATDVRRYGKWMREEAEKRVGHLYPRVTITSEMARERNDLGPFVGQQLPALAWMWARTVKSPNPAFSSVDVPLATSFVLLKKRERAAYVHPVIHKSGYEFTIKIGTPPEGAKGGTTAGKRQAFRCLMSGAAIGYDYIRQEGKAGRMGQKLMAIVAETPQGRVYLAPNAEHECVAFQAAPLWRPDTALPNNARDFKTPNYGLNTFGELFTDRQLVTMTTFSDLVAEAQQLIRRDAVAAGLPDDDTPLIDGGLGACAYAEAVCVYLSCALSRMASYNNSICHWNMVGGSVAQIFSRHSIPMSWDFIEVNGLAKMSGNWDGGVEWVAETVETLGRQPSGLAIQLDARLQEHSAQHFISTDPPYYDNIGYADLSDFFYVWLRRTLRPLFPDLFATISVPKAEELIATPYRHETKEDAEAFFLDGMTQAMQSLAENAHPGAPATIYYAFKQSDTSDDGTNSTGWEAFLEAVLRAGYSLTGTWPVRTEKTGRMLEFGNNALASSIILVCRPRPKNAGTISRRHFVRLLNEALPLALDAMTRGEDGGHSPVAPVDLSQAIIGPGMAIFSRYDAVLEADGTPMTVKSALQLINRFLAEDDFDGDTQFCLHWFEQHGWDTGKFGEADTLARAKGTSVSGVKAAGVIEAGGGNVRLLKWKEYPADWNASLDTRIPVWEALHQLILAYSSRGDAGAAKVLKAVAGQAEAARQLAYRLYTLCERKGWAEDARAYNEVVTGWGGIEQAVSDGGGSQQRELFVS
jgi:putative DNA methylase